jgi:hypothetical protein
LPTTCPPHKKLICSKWFYPQPLVLPGMDPEWSGGGGGAVPALVSSCVHNVCHPPINLLHYCKVLLDYCIWIWIVVHSLLIIMLLLKLLYLILSLILFGFIVKYSTPSGNWYTRHQYPPPPPRSRLMQATVYTQPKHKITCTKSFWFSEIIKLIHSHILPYISCLWVIFYLCPCYLTGGYRWFNLMENHSTSILMILVHTCSPHKSQLSIFLPMLEQGGEGFKIVIGGFKIAHLGGNCPNSRRENFRHSISKNYHSVCAITVKPDVPLQATLQYCLTIL